MWNNMSILKSIGDWHMFCGQNWISFNVQLSENNVFGIHLVCDLQNKPIPISSTLSWNPDFSPVLEFRTYPLQVFS